MIPKREELLQDLTNYIVNEVLQDPTSKLEPTSPLLEWGILKSMNIMQLMAYLHNHHRVMVPPQELTGANFKDLVSITDMVIKLKDSSVGGESPDGRTENV